MQRYSKAINTEGRDRYPVVHASESAPKVVGGEMHFMSAYRRYFDNPESHLFPTDYLSSPSKAAAAAAKAEAFAAKQAAAQEAARQRTEAAAERAMSPS